MKLEQVKSLIIQIVSDKQGCKGVELVTELASQVYMAQKEPSPEFDIPQILSDMADDGEIIEIEYWTPVMEYRVKSFYLPKGSEVFCEKAHHCKTLGLK